MDFAQVVRRALAEDLGVAGDVTTAATVPASVTGNAIVVAREPMVLAGLPMAREAFHQIDPALQMDDIVTDGQRVAAGDTVATIHGRMASILTAERVALNFLQHLSGIATQTARYVQVLQGTGVRLLDTRKTTPGLRMAEKYAVRAGGGSNHRSGLFDGILIKDNHIRAAGSVTAAVDGALAARHPLIKIEVEVESLEQALEAVEAGAEALLLDNRTVVQLVELVGAVRRVAPGVFVEASGGVTLDTLAAVAATGVDGISSGAVIHGARWVDLGLDIP